MTSLSGRFARRWPLHVAIFVSAVIVVAGRYVMADWWWRNYAFKPLTTLLLSLLAATAPAAGAARYKKYLVLGLLCSLAGDIFLMLPHQLFLAGLAAFLLAHLCYLAAFFTDSRLTWRLSSPLWLLPGAFVFARIQPGLSPGLLAPVLLYLLVITMMAHQAYMRALTLRGTGAWMAAAGALLFVASDSILALNKFHARIDHAGIWILGTYYMAQWLIAASVYRTPDLLPEEHDGVHR